MQRKARRHRIELKVTIDGTPTVHICLAPRKFRVADGGPLREAADRTDQTAGGSVSRAGWRCMPNANTNACSSDLLAASVTSKPL